MSPHIVRLFALPSRAHAAACAASAVACIALLSCHPINTSDADAGPEGGAPACNTLLQRGPTVEVETSAGGAPASNGGNIQDGTYVLTRLVVHDPRATTEGRTGVGLRQTIEITKGLYTQVESDGRGDARSTGKLVVDGTSVRQVEACVAPERTQPASSEMPAFGFNASDAGLVLQLDDRASDAGVVTVLTYQPRSNTDP